jgi:hypothetical protein
MGAKRRRQLAGTYFNPKPTGKAVWEKDITMSTFRNYRHETAPCTLQDYRDAEREGLIALHEASHATAAFAMRLPLTGMIWVDDPSQPPKGVPRGARAFVLQQGLADNLKKSVGEKLALAKMSVFTELSGVYGLSDEAYSPNLLQQDRTLRHFCDAVKMFRAYQWCTTPAAFKGFCLCAAVDATEDADACEEVRRIIPVVKHFFADRRVKALTQGLANYFVQKKCIDGDEIYEFLNEGWVECSRIVQEMEEAEVAESVGEVSNETL